MKLYINEQVTRGHIEPEVYGHFSEHLGRCIYGGLYVGEDSPIPNTNGMRTDVVEALKELQIPVLRWPGGCFADEYHWKDGIGPKAQRKKMINTTWGGVVEDNSFGTHEFMELCRQLGCKAYVNGNLGSGTVQEMSEWVEYMTYDGLTPMTELRKQNGREDPWRLSYFAVGNENWGGGGNMTPSYYGNLYRHYQTFLRQYDPDKPIFKIACGPNVDDYYWMRGVLETCYDHTEDKFHGFLDGISLHYYVHPEGWEKKGHATRFDSATWYKSLGKALYMDELIRRHGEILSEFDPEGRVALVVDEWGGWYNVEEGTNPGFLYQQNTMRDALIAGITLNIFNQHCDRVKLACLAQVVNVLQAVLLTDGEQMIKTPTYHVFHMFRHHQDADLLAAETLEVPTVGEGEWQLPKVTQSVSQKDGAVTITLNNLSLDSAEPVDIRFTEKTGWQVQEARIVTGAMTAHNTFDAPETVTEQPFTDYAATEKGLQVTVPPCSVLMLRLN
ncbi:MAG: alpha-N-arabinofuranosidase [Clostridiales bacterium]|nr:alpha-N-arabinofuranosidase [Clostridiales bacterium]